MENSEIRKIIMDYYRARNNKYTGMMIAATVDKSKSIADTTMRIVQEIMNDLTVNTPMNRITVPMYVAAMNLASKAILTGMEADQREIYEAIVDHTDQITCIEVPAEKYRKNIKGENSGT